MSTPIGMIPVEEFSKEKNISVELAIKKIKKGFYNGKLVGEQWFISYNPIKSNESIISVNVENQVTGLPSLTILFYSLAGISLLAGFYICSILWPSHTGHGKQIGLIYIPSIIWLTAGIIEFALFTALGQGLAYLKQIVLNTTPDKQA